MCSPGCAYCGLSSARTGSTPTGLVWIVTAGWNAAWKRNPGWLWAEEAQKQQPIAPSSRSQNRLKARRGSAVALPSWRALWEHAYSAWLTRTNDGPPSAYMLTAVSCPHPGNDCVINPELLFKLLLTAEGVNGINCLGSPVTNARRRTDWATPAIRHCQRQTWDGVGAASRNPLVFSSPFMALRPPPANRLTVKVQQEANSLHPPTSAHWLHVQKEESEQSPWVALTHWRFITLQGPPFYASQAQVQPLILMSFAAARRRDSETPAVAGSSSSDLNRMQPSKASRCKHPRRNPPWPTAKLATRTLVLGCF